MSPILMWSQIHCSFPLRKKKISESSSSIRSEASLFSGKEKPNCKGRIPAIGFYTSGTNIRIISRNILSFRTKGNKTDLYASTLSEKISD
jgi:hypothetical protein